MVSGLQNSTRENTEKYIVEGNLMQDQLLIEKKYMLSWCFRPSRIMREPLLQPIYSFNAATPDP